MASSCEVTLTLGYDANREDLHDYVTTELPDEAVGHTLGQHLDLVCGKETHPDGLPGSGQAGAVRIYAGLIRRGNDHAIREYLAAAPWRGVEAVLVIHNEFGPPIVERLGDHRPAAYR